METWKDAFGFEDYLMVSNFGNVRGKDTIRTSKIGISRKVMGKPFRPWLGKNGYKHIAVLINGQRRKILVHRLVGLTFIPNPHHLLSINHIDGNKLNNSLENLEWCSLAENTAKQWKTGLVNLRGANHPGSKLTFEDVHRIRNNEERAKDLALALGVSESCIYQVRQRRKWAHI